jgi:hypothetical protein
VDAETLARLRGLAGVAEAVGRAGAAVDAAYRHPALRRSGGRVAAEVALRSAVASAALAGSDHELAEVRAGTVTDPVVQGALRCAEAVPGLVDTWRRAPGQALARLHLLAGRGALPPDLLGRPVADRAVATRLAALTELVSRAGYGGGADADRAGAGLLGAAVVHGELLALRAFPGPYGVVARAAARLELMASGFDPRGLVAADRCHLARRPEYVGAAGAFATGTPDGVRAWLRHCAGAVERAAGEAAEVAALAEEGVPDR